MQGQPTDWTFLKLDFNISFINCAKLFLRSHSNKFFTIHLAEIALWKQTMKRQVTVYWSFYWISPVQYYLINLKCILMYHFRNAELFVQRAKNGKVLKKRNAFKKYKTHTLLLFVWCGRISYLIDSLKSLVWRILEGHIHTGALFFSLL